MSAEALTSMTSPLMTNASALAQYSALGALPFATQQTALLNGASYTAAMGQRMDGLPTDLSAYQGNFNAAHMAQYQARRHLWWPGGLGKLEG